MTSCGSRLTKARGVEMSKDLLGASPASARARLRASANDGLRPVAPGSGLRPAPNPLTPRCAAALSVAPHESAAAPLRTGPAHRAGRTRGLAGRARVFRESG